MHRNIVIAPCGNKAHLFKDKWLQFKNEKEFDLCLLFYHEQINDPEKYNDADYFFHLKGFKYFMLHHLFTQLACTIIKLIFLRKGIYTDGKKKNK